MSIHDPPLAPVDVAVLHRIRVGRTTPAAGQGHHARALAEQGLLQRLPSGPEAWVVRYELTPKGHRLLKRHTEWLSGHPARSGLESALAAGDNHTLTP